MELIGRIKRRKIYYLQIRNNSTWKNSFPKKDWIAFTIANKEEEELIPPVAKVCLDRNVSFICSAGNYGHMTEFFFDEEIAFRGLEYEQKKAEEINDDNSPVTTAHENFEEGFWFAATVADDDQFEIDKVVCIDLTKKKMRSHLVKLIERIEKGWFPGCED